MILVTPLHYEGSCCSIRSNLLVLDAIQPIFLEFLSHSDLIPDADLTLTLMRKRFNEILSIKNDSIELESRTFSIRF